MNLVVMRGNLTRDPALKYTPGGTAICEFTIANSKKWKDAQSGEQKERPGFFNCICWGVRGEKLAELFKKGKPILVRGELEFQQWEDKDGNKRNAVKINVQDWFFQSDKAAAASADSNTQGNDTAYKGGTDINDEEIPF